MMTSAAILKIVNKIYNKLRTTCTRTYASITVCKWCCSKLVIQHNQICLESV